MYWPSHPKDVEYVFQHHEGSLLPVDDILATYTDWTDVSLWPTSSRAETLMAHSAKSKVIRWPSPDSSVPFVAVTV